MGKRTKDRLTRLYFDHNAMLARLAALEARPDLAGVMTRIARIDDYTTETRCKVSGLEEWRGNADGNMDATDDQVKALEALTLHIADGEQIATKDRYPAWKERLTELTAAIGKPAEPMGKWDLCPVASGGCREPCCELDMGGCRVLRNPAERVAKLEALAEQLAGVAKPAGHAQLASLIDEARGLCK